jgi:thiol-disulfide isomerase/thioredoxin
VSLLRSLVCAVALAACASAPPRAAVTTLPADGKLIDDGASFVAAQRYAGKVVVLDFWASWCEACRKSVPKVARLAAAYAADGLVVVGVNSGDDPAKAAASARELTISYPIALDPDQTFTDRVGAAKLPTVLVIDKTGAIVHRGNEIDEETLAVVRRLLGK